MRKWRAIAGAAFALAAVLAMHQLAAQRRPEEAAPPPVDRPAAITVDYPSEGSVFPPDFAPPTFLWRDPDERATAWRIEIAFSDGSASLGVQAAGEKMRVGEIDARAIGPTNQLPALTPQQATARTWVPDVRTWETIKRHSVERPATLAISGIGGNPPRTLSRGSVTIVTSKDPVGAPIFFRDVPLMPSETQKGVIKPLAANAIPLIAWRVRNVSEPRSRVVLEGMHTCANCHSFSSDGKTLGMDLDGPQNDKGLYALVDLRPTTVIRNQDVVPWTSFRDKVQGDLRVGFMSRVSPDGRYVVTAIKPPGMDRQPLYYVANFKDYRFLQVFYPTSGILVWYDRAAGRLQPLPGADDPRYVHANASWSPDGKYLVFVRAEVKEAYPAGRKLAEYANDPNELPMQYDLYRIPFQGGKGGRAEPVAGASHNGMSNTFPKISPDGRWIVFVKSHNGMILRPDSQLYIVPAAGGQARRMRCNTPLMNSWHSFSPNGRWLVFSSKSRSPYTGMFLTHIDEDGNDTPAILIENATAANRAVNIPEFVNIPPDGLMKIETPATEFYRLADLAGELTGKGEYDAAVAQWQKAFALTSDDARAQNNFGYTLAKAGRLEEAVAHYRKALELRPEYAEAEDNLGVARAGEGKRAEAIVHYQRALELNPELAEAHNNLGRALAEEEKTGDAIAHFEKAVELDPKYAEAHNNLGIALAATGKLDAAIAEYEKALDLNPQFAEAHNNLGVALSGRGRSAESIAHYETALKINPAFADAHTNLGITLCGQGQLDQAIPHLKSALSLDPHSAEARTNLGAALLWKGDLDGAIAELDRAVSIAPKSVGAHRYLGDALSSKGRTREALVQWRAALRAEPDQLAVLNAAAWVLATNPDSSLRNGAEAVELAERAVRLSGGNEPRTLVTLAAAYAEAGRFSDALRAVHAALDAGQGNPPLAKTLNAMIALYQAKTPLRAPPQRPVTPFTGNQSIEARTH